MQIGDNGVAMQGWVLEPSSTQEVDPDQVHALFSSVSPQFHHERNPDAPDTNPSSPGAEGTAEEGAQPSTSGGNNQRPSKDACSQLRLGQSTVLLDAPDSNSVNAEKGRVDVVMYTGGLVWCTAFCPLGCPPPSSTASTPAARPQKRAKSGPSTDAGSDPSSAPQSVDLWPAGAKLWRSSSQAHTTELLAVAVHPKHSARNPQGQAREGMGAVQLWSVPSGSQSTCCPGGVPRCELSIIHQGVVVWDLQWCEEPWLYLDATCSQSRQEPDSTGAGQSCDTIRTMGILGMAVGDGSAQVFVVPDPSDEHIQQLITAKAAASAAPSASPAAAAKKQTKDAGGDGEGGEAAPSSVSLSGVILQPHVHIPASSLGGTASCVAFRPLQPHLLVGCWDGSVSVWQLPGTAANPLAQLMPLLMIRADGTPVRRALWHPVEQPSGFSAPASSSSAAAAGDQGASLLTSHTSHSVPGQGVWLDSLDKAPHHQFMTCSQSGHLRVWDMRDVFSCVLDRVVSRVAVYDAAWIAGPVPGRTGVAMALDDGTLRNFNLAPAHYYMLEKAGVVTVMAGVDPACLWSVSYSPGMNLLATAGEEGVVCLGFVDQEHDNRMRKPHIPLGGLVSDHGVLRLVGPRQVGGLPCVYGGGTQFSTSIPAPNSKTPTHATSVIRDSIQTLYCVCWSPNVLSVANALAGSKPTGEKPYPYDTCATWLAYGGMSGLVRCTRVGWDQIRG